MSRVSSQVMAGIAPASPSGPAAPGAGASAPFRAPAPAPARSPRRTRPSRSRSTTTMRRSSGSSAMARRERRLELATLERRVRARARVGQPEQRLLALARQAPLAGGEPVEAEPRGDRVEPGRELGVAAKVAERAMGPEEGLLRHFLGLGPVAQHAKGHPEHAMLVGRHQLLEGAGIAGAQPVQEARRVACLRLSHGKTIPRPGSSRRNKSRRWGAGRDSARRGAVHLRA